MNVLFKKNAANYPIHDLGKTALSASYTKCMEDIASELHVSRPLSIAINFSFQVHTTSIILLEYYVF